jgi:biotin operon repressor
LINFIQNTQSLTPKRLKANNLKSQNLVKIDPSRKKVGFGVSYSEADLAFIEANIRSMKLTEIAAHLNRSFDSVRIKVEKMGLTSVRLYTFKKFSDAEIAFLQENGSKYSTEELAQKMGRSFDSVEKRLRILNIKSLNPRSFQRLSPKDIKYLKKNYQKYTNTLLAQKLGVSSSAIGKKLQKLELVTPRTYVSKKK